MAPKVLLVLACVVALAFADINRSGLTEGERSVLDAFPGIRSHTELARMMAAINLNMREAATRNATVSSSMMALEALKACPAIPTPAPTDDLRNVKPGNIKIVMGMGDSITAAMSAKDSTVLVLREYRGIAFPIGGDPGVVTMPNILKQYAPGLVGMSTGIGKIDDSGYKTNGLNAAVSGAIVQNMTAQAMWLVDALRKRTDVKPATDWKMVNIWIGSNNLCKMCNDHNLHNDVIYETDLRAALQNLTVIPRMIINLLPNLDITDLFKFNGLGCSVVHPIACPCATSTNAATRKSVQDMIMKFHRIVYKLAGEFNGRGYADKAVVVHPFLAKTIIPQRDYLSAADCFHPAPVAHADLSVALWNSLITPPAQRQLQWKPFSDLQCATQSSIIATCLNTNCCNKDANAAGYC
eukprot:TRINITY_DN334_c0_g1_i2.p1 TRINITY_DN334_c0_g1~~TRINITY_DN334_c0_g1_i2.p1  ORF type:complete len:410 (-),score=134.17 TRINITY_DN334_c0_g1_i2:85-1314(-)